VKVAVHYYQHEAAANETLAGVRACESDGFVVQADVSRPGEVRRMFQEVEDHFGALDIFVSNARPELPAFYQPPLDQTLDTWNMALDSQATAFLVGAQESARMMTRWTDRRRDVRARRPNRLAARIGRVRARPRSSRSAATSPWPLRSAASR
jgi:NAD(P)-dependent dehydrogenase (short-subunit alcohol dehydrogenase family)